MTYGAQPALDALAQLRDLMPLELADDVAGRLRKGAEEYGDASLRRPAGELLGEMREEALDIIGWGCVLLASTTSQLESPIRHAVAIAARAAAVIDAAIALDQDRP